ncbi:MAG: SRPBCC domain-containing protein [bacterium]
MSTIREQIILPCEPETAFHAWLDEKAHSAMVNADAHISPEIGGKFRLWGRTITGVTTGIDKESLSIDQDWHFDWPGWSKEEPSHVELSFDSHKNGCVLSFVQTSVPPKHLKELREGWEDNYWKPMKEYFAKVE